MYRSSEIYVYSQLVLRFTASTMWRKFYYGRSGVFWTRTIALTWTFQPMPHQASSYT